MNATAQYQPVDYNIPNLFSKISFKLHEFKTKSMNENYL